MDLYQIEKRLLVLECLKENAANMRTEQQQVRESITSALIRARNSLASIRALSSELIEMKAAVESALAETEEARINVIEAREDIALAEGQAEEVVIEEEQIKEVAECLPDENVAEDMRN
ncbi:hypothetical protein KR044_012857 [Drosophila immigrans]|nr:hypothetical protein KR044_012857 [Drosophila immigrans]